MSQRFKFAARGQDWSMYSDGTQSGVLRSLLRDHDGLILLQVEPQQTLLVTELLHLFSPHHRLSQFPLHLAAVAPRCLVARRRKIIEDEKQFSAHIRIHLNFTFKKDPPCSTSRWTCWHTSRCRSLGSFHQAPGSRFSYRAGCNGYSSHTWDPAAG